MGHKLIKDKTIFQSSYQLPTFFQWNFYPLPQTQASHCLRWNFSIFQTVISRSFWVVKLINHIGNHSTLIWLPTMGLNVHVGRHKSCFHLFVNDLFNSFSSSFFSISRDFLGWAVLLNFLVYITIPVVLQYTGILLGVGSFAIYVNTIIGLAKRENYFWEQVIKWKQIVLALKFESFSSSLDDLFSTYSIWLQSFIVYSCWTFRTFRNLWNEKYSSLLHSFMFSWKIQLNCEPF